MCNLVFQKDFLSRAFIELYILFDVPCREMLSVTESWQNVSAIYQQPQLYIFPGLLYLVGLTNTVAIRKATPSESQCSYKSKDHRFCSS